MAFAPLTPFLLAAALVAATPLGETEFVASATSTQFRAHNPNDYTVLMILGDAAHGARAQMLVAPQMQFETTFPSGTLEGLYMEVVFFAPTGRVSSGAVPFEDMLATGVERFEVDTDSGDVQAWIVTNGVRLEADSGLMLAPSSLIDSTAPATQPLMLDPNHVPVITPDDVYNNSVAPKIQSVNPTV